jgi:predicted permease
MEVDSSELGYRGPQSAALNRRILERLGAMSGVESVTFTGNGIYSTRNGNGQVLADGFQAEPGPHRSAFFDHVGPRFFSTLGTRILAGRDFDDRDTPAAPPATIVNQQFANHFFAGRNPIGSNIYMTSPSGRQTIYQVVGVVQDVVPDVRRAPRRAFYLPQLQTESSLSNPSFVVRTRPGSPSAATDLRALIRAEGGGARIARINTADELLNRTLSLDRLIAMLAFAFGVLALILAAVGIYGLLAYNVARRTGEIGIRMALGATRGLVMALIFREIAWVAAIGVAAGLGAAIALGKLVAGLVFGLQPGDPLVLAPAAVLLTLVAAGAAWLPARRASRLNPSAALRTE